MAIWRSVARNRSGSRARLAGARRLLSHGALALVIVAVGGCRAEPPASPPRPSPSQTSGRVLLTELERPVTVVRDRWGIPHITAQSADDLFVAQGFVQAQDRLFQMDLWRRSVQGRLAEVLGANFIERDAMTRRVQYRGTIEAEWASYLPDVRQVASSFVRGINAFVDRALGDLPEEFGLAGWTPERWRPEDLLNRTDAFSVSANAQDEVFRARLVAAVGASRADRLLPLPGGRAVAIPPGLDLSAVTYVLGDAMRRVGTPPFFSGLAGEVPAGSNAWAIRGARSRSGAALVAGDPHRSFDNPSLTYLVHLKAPGWNVVGATAPWLPGVAIGHNDQVAWSMSASAIDVQDVFVERLSPSGPHQVQEGGRFVDVEVERDAVHVKGRPEPFEYERQYTRHGVIVGLDRERHLAYALRWSGTDRGSAPGLGALTINRVRTAAEFRRALSRWTMPPAEFVFADRQGHIGRQVAALVPVRAGATGGVPTAAWSAAGAWRGWINSDDLPAAFDPPEGFVVAANDNLARVARITDTLRGGGLDVEGFKRLQHDVLAWNAARLVPLLDRLRADDDEVDRARQRLLGWNHRVEAGAADAALYVAWEHTLLRTMVARRIPGPLVEEFLGRVGSVVPLLVHPTRAWFDGDPTRSRDALLVEALGLALTELRRSGRDMAWGRSHTITFRHPLGVGDAARRRFEVGPFPAAGYADTVLANSPTSGPSLRVIFDVADWDRSVATQAPGQSASPTSPHFADLALLWSTGTYFPLAFTDAAVEANAEATLVLSPN